MMQKKRIFISYGNDDYVSLAEKLNDDLKKQGYDTWFGAERLLPGKDWESAIEEGLAWVRDAPKKGYFLLLMTPYSVRRPDGFCLRELAKANSLRLPVIPILVSDCPQPLSIFNIQNLDMRGCFPPQKKRARYRKKFLRLMEAVEKNNLDLDGTQTRLVRQLRPLEFRSETAFHLPRFTGREWVRQAVRDWIDAPDQSNVFWITGEPGTGKTALSVWLCDNIPEISAIHLCNQNDNVKSDPLRIIRSVAYQLSTQLPGYLDRLKQLAIEDILSDSPNGAALFDQLILEPLASDGQPGDGVVIILIDALDEVSKDGKNELARLIALESPKCPPWLRFIITSRPAKTEAEIKSYFFKKSSFKLEPSLDSNMKDIRMFLEKELSPIAAHKNLTLALETIAKQSEGNFLYARYICDELKRPGGELSLDHLEEFPKGLSGVYSYYFERQFSQITDYRSEFRDIISVVLAAREPLYLETLRGIFGWSKTKSNDILPALGSLFPIREDRIRVFHLSVKEWLTDPVSASFYYIDVEEGHQLLADYCCNYREIELERAIAYVLEYAAGHLFEINDHERLWVLLNDEAFRERQLALEGHYEFSFDALQMGIDTYIGRNGKRLDDARLCRLAMRAGELGTRAKSSIQKVIQKFLNHESSTLTLLNQTLKQLRVLDGENYFLAMLLLAWTELERLLSLPPDKRKIKFLERIIGTFEKEISKKTGIVDWTKQVPRDFMVWWVCRMLSIVSYKDLFPFIIRSSSHTSLVKEGKEHLKSDDYIQVRDQLVNLSLESIEMIELGNQEKAKAFVTVAEEIVDCPPYQEKTITTLRSAISHAEKIKDEIERRNHFEHIAQVLGRVGDYKKTKSLFQRILKVPKGLLSLSLKSSIYKAVAGALAEAQEFKKAFSLVNLIKEDEFTNLKGDALSEIASHVGGKIKGTEAADITAKIIELIGYLENDAHKVEVLCAVATSWERLGENRKAVEYFEKALVATENSISNYGQDRALCYLTETFERLGNLVDKKAIFTWMFKVTLIIDAGEDREYNIEMPLYYLSELLKEVSEPGLAQMLNNAVDPREKKRGIFLFLEFAYHLEEDREKANYFFQKAVKSVDETDWTFQPQRKPKELVRIAGQMNKAGEYQWSEEIFLKALKAVEEIEEPDETEGPLQSIASGVAHCKYLPNKDDIFEKIITLTQEIESDNERSKVLETIAFKFNQFGQYPKALTVAESIPGDKQKNYIHYCISKDLAEAEKFDEALRVINMISDRREKSENLISLSKAISMTGDIRAATGISLEVINVEDKNNVPVIRLNNLTLLSQALAYTGYSRTAGNTAAQIVDEARKNKLLQVLSFIGNEVAVNGQRPDLLEKISHELNLTLKELAVLQAERGELENAGKIRQCIVEDNFRGKYIKADLLHTVSLKFIENRQYEKALQEIIENTEDRIRRKTINYLFKRLICEKKSIIESIFPQLTPLVRNGFPPWIRVSIIRIWVSHLLESEHCAINVKVQILNDLLELKSDEPIWWGQYEIEETSVILAALVKLEERPKDVSVFSNLISTAGRIEADGSRTQALGAIAAALYWCGLTQEAGAHYHHFLNLMEGIPYPFPRVNTLCTIAQLMALIGKGDKTVELLKSAFAFINNINSEYERQSALGTIILTLRGVLKVPGWELIVDELMTTVETIKSNEKKSHLYAVLLADTSILANPVFDDKIYQRALTSVRGIAVAQDRSRYLSHELAPTFLRDKKHDVFIEFLSQSSLSHESCRDVLINWQNYLLQHLNPPDFALRDSFRYYPFVYPIALNGVFKLLLFHIKEGNFEICRKIIRLCPQLGLDFLLQDEGINKTAEGD